MTRDGTLPHPPVKPDVGVAELVVIGFVDDHDSPVAEESRKTR